MCDLLYDCGGATASSSFTSTFNQLTSSTSNYITKNSASASAAVNAYQTASIDIDGGTWPGCTIDMNQKINVSSQTSVQLTASQVQQLATNLATQIGTTANQYASGNSSTFGGSASSATNTTAATNITQIVNQNVNNDTYTSMSNQVMGNQTGKIHIKGGCHAPIHQDQNFQANVLATNIVSTVLNQLGGMTSNTTSTTAVTQASTATTKGPFESMFGWLSQLGPIGALCCVLLILMSCAGCAFLAFMMFGPKGGAPQPS
jgi:hypothetical protein